MTELLGFCVLLLATGNETSINLIGNAMLTSVRSLPVLFEKD